jgi:nitrogenase molybdenum-iron protein NifN
MFHSEEIMKPVTENACSLCAPLGAALAFKGVEGCVPLLHGSQGCATYIRRYMISHFKEPVDIASSNFHEDTAIFGGGANLRMAIDNILRQYRPKIIGIASTCLSETIGDDVPMMLKEIRKANPDYPPLIFASTPSYSGSHEEGYWKSLSALVDQLLPEGPSDMAGKRNDLLPLFTAALSPADQRHLKDLVGLMGLFPCLVPDSSETLDGGKWEEYETLPRGGVSLESLQNMIEAKAGLHLGAASALREISPLKILGRKSGLAPHFQGLPVGIRATDRFLALLQDLSGQAIPKMLLEERSRLIDAYVDSHKILSGLKAMVFGDEDLVAGLVPFLAEIGVKTLVAASGSRSGQLKKSLESLLSKEEQEGMQVVEGADYATLEKLAEENPPDFFMGSSKGYAMARKTKTPLIRVGFPIHDRVGGPSIRILGYGGARELFERICNGILEVRQEATGVGFSYL